MDTAYNCNPVIRARPGALVAELWCYGYDPERELGHRQSIHHVFNYLVAHYLNLREFGESLINDTERSDVSVTIIRDTMTHFTWKEVFPAAEGTRPFVRIQDLKLSITKDGGKNGEESERDNL